MGMFFQCPWIFNCTWDANFIVDLHDLDSITALENMMPSSTNQTHFGKIVLDWLKPQNPNSIQGLEGH
jgi:hypothetical protein